MDGKDFDPMLCLAHGNYSAGLLGRVKKKRAVIVDSEASPDLSRLLPIAAAGVPVTDMIQP